MTSINTLPIWLVVLALFVAMVLSAVAGLALHSRRRRLGLLQPDDGREGYVVSAVLGLLALLLGFTLSLALDRFEARRTLVLQEANAIGAAYLRSQLLPEPERTRLSDLLVHYTDNRIALAKARVGSTGPLLAVNDALITDIWAAGEAGFDRIRGIDFSSTFLEAVNDVVSMDLSRKAARMARVPDTVVVALVMYLLTTAGVLGYVMTGRNGRATSMFLLLLLTLALALIVDINRPTMGTITESQAPMELLRAGLLSRPRASFDRWRVPPPAAAPPAAQGAAGG
jgi:hypothetical protein